jgi:hypothetical protein
MDEFDEIISKIRRGEIILWVGSGFSRLAGYPTGSELANIIKEKLNPSEKQYFENKSNLDEVTEEFVQIRKRGELESILSEVFKKEPIDLTYHKMVSEIPQIETIITTNYDKSFEYAYGNDIFPIIGDKDCSSIRRNKVSLYKIHGDIDISDSMIVTKSDYRDYYDSGKNDLIWNEIKPLISRYSILFIGYSFEDPNIMSIFEDILKRLGDLHKDCYLISRKLHDHKQRHLLENYSIHYISMDAKEAITNIQKEVENNLLIDAGNGYIPQHRISKLFLNRNINTRFIVADEGKLTLDRIDPLDDGSKIIWNLQFEASEKSSRIQEFQDIINGNTFGNCTLSQDDCKINASAKIGDILLFDPKKGNPSSITIKSNPDRLISANFTFRKSDLCFYNLKGERYSSVSAGEIRLFHDVFDLTIKMKAGKPEQSIRLNIHAKNVMEGYDIYKFINAWIEEDELKIHFDFLDIPYILPFSKMFSEKDVKLMKQNYDFYAKVFRIQRELDVNFGDINSITPADLNTLNRIILLLDGGKLPLENEISFKMKVSNKEQFLVSLDKEDGECKIGPIQYPFTFLGTDITLGGNIYLYNGLVANKKEVVSALTKGFDDISVTMKSKSDDCFLLL